MRRILVLAYSRQAGGAERSALKLAKSLSQESEYNVTFGTLIQSKKDFYPVPIGVQSINFFPVLNFFLRLRLPFRKVWIPFVLLFDVFHFRRVVKNRGFDNVISFGAGVGCVTFLALPLLKISQITSERINPDPLVYKPSTVARVFRPFIYRHKVICSVQTTGFANWVESTWGITATVTPNHFDLPINNYVFSGNEGPVIAVGRPAYQKGYDILLAAWGLVELETNRELWIVCDDSEGFVANLIADTKCKNVRILGLMPNLEELYEKSSIFISTARFEGYPNAVAEAIIFGIPVLTTITSDVVHDWVELGICAPIRETAPGPLAHTILALLENNSYRQELSQIALSNRSLFSWDTARKSWESAINDSMAEWN